MSRFLRSFIIATVLFVGTTAHVGSPNAIFDGNAGGYPVRVVVRPPEVIPGTAEISVRILDGGADVQRVAVRPVFWRTGRQGSPAADDAARVPGPDHLFTGKLWLMSTGAYNIEVEVSGPRGTGTVSVPVVGAPTAEVKLGTGLTIMLVVLGAVLVAGLLSIVHAAAGEALSRPGTDVPQPGRRRARIATAVAVPVVLALTVGGWNWWQAEAASYRRTLYRSLDTRAMVVDSGIAGAGRQLAFVITDSTWTPQRMTPLIPDHGKIMHMFVIESSAPRAAFAHLHPERIDDSTFVTSLPALPPGAYDVYGDIVHESGFTRTLVGTVRVDRSDATAAPGLDPDDSWHLASAEGLVRTPDGLAAAVPGGAIVWLGGGTEALRAGAETTLRFALRDGAGQPLGIEPYMGMGGHAVVLRDDASVFIHLHPMGTGAMAAQQAFEMRERGDTTEAGRLRIPAGGADPGAAGSHAGHGAGLTSTVSFPYMFPKAGQYTVWVQVKHAGRVLTAQFDAAVGG
ncbi:MAG: hypothetical protein H0X64_11670 [Gemmatimonadaceae bacterium]|nr:hypothetical protein [Gemmatimonadaceae bacterium]